MDAPSLPDSPPPPDRRRFLSRLSLALSGAVGALLGVPVVGFLLAPLTRKEPRVWRAVGRVEDFAIGETEPLGGTSVPDSPVVNS